MDIAQWLNGIGLGQYETLFREHEIDADVLVDLTEADLEKIGVPLGHRKRLMRAIASLSGSGPSHKRRAIAAVRSRAPAAASRPPATPRRRAAADHRDVLRSRRLDGSRGAARRRGLAQSGRRLSRRGRRPR